jgi:hypothetical protein
MRVPEIVSPRCVRIMIGWLLDTETIPLASETV